MEVCKAIKEKVKIGAFVSIILKSSFGLFVTVSLLEYRAYVHLFLNNE